MAPLLVLFDGYCNLCSGGVQFIMKRDRRKRFRFAPLTGPTATQALGNINTSAVSTDSIILIEGGNRFDQSAAVLRIARKMDGAWPLAYCFIIVPRFLRDAVYRFIARKRYRWFGQTETCWMPWPGWEDRFPDMQINKTQ